MFSLTNMMPGGRRHGVYGWKVCSLLIFHVNYSLVVIAYKCEYVVYRLLCMQRTCIDVKDMRNMLTGKYARTQECS